MAHAGRGLLLAALLLAASAPAQAEAPPRGTLRVQPTRVGIGLGYAGTTLEVEAAVPAGYQAAVRLTGHRQRLELKRLGKRAGLLWMNVGEVAFDDVPVVYQLATSAPLAALGSPATLARLGLGYDAVLPPAAPLRGELVRLKQHEGLFAVREAALARDAAQEPPGASVAAAGTVAAAPPTRLRATITLPPRAPIGEYVVDLIGFKDQEGTVLATTTVRLEQEGAVRALRRLAVDHGLLYGIVASAIAIVVGLLTGLVFQPKSDDSH
jgi:hypothetical protein